jgi:hypothetical protein
MEILVKKKTKSKTFVFSVRLKGVGPESRKKLMSVGLNKDLELSSCEITFKDERGWGFKHSMFLMAIEEQREELCKEHVECVVREKRGR